MSSVIFKSRLQDVEKSGRYSKEVINKFEDIASKNNGELPRVFTLEGLGTRTISGVLTKLGYVSFSITAPLGAKSSSREVILPSKSVTKKPAG